ncbi:MAG: ArsR/SmtB family transcription factor [Nitrososphaeraceae archaeon]
MPKNGAPIGGRENSNNSGKNGSEGGSNGDNFEGNPRPQDDRGYYDPRLTRLLWYLIGSTRGGVNRARILELIYSRPANANQIALELKIDYKTVTHHLDVLSRNGLVITDNKEAYGSIYFLTPLMEKNYKSFTRILVKFGKK